ncbi:hypothetical protein CEXT_402012 [Caerostris extrusa]|uniref:FAD-binding FR-type domain-containing protein n=1 Tax=Caerostris extrusa TaxID=172846 RepID=A0AAV4Y010_CAEEX|nr:hypothetical protein CEXT_402012 [Caerostris extrusa]
MITKIIESYCTQILKISHCFSSQRQIHSNVIRYSSRADFRMAPNVFHKRLVKIYTAVVEDVFNASSTIKILRLYIKEAGFSFKAGQWVDFYVPGIQEVTGYSMTSPPNEAKEKGILELAVKYGTFPPTHWVHNSCSPGGEVQIRVGGDFYYDPLANKKEAEANLLLIGGGVACFSRYFADIEREHPTLTCQYFVTRQPKTGPSPDSRIEEKNVGDSIKTLGKKTLCYVCGPSTMTDDVANMLLKIGIEKEYIRYEKWW